MADILADIAPTTLLPQGHYGAPGEGVRARLLPGWSAATLAARRGAGEALAARFAEAGLVLPAGPKAATAAGLTLVGTGPGRWLAFAQGTGTLPDRIAPLADGLAAVTDQSDASLMFEVSGPSVRAALAKGVMIDLDPSAFAPGDAATTTVSHVNLTFWQTPEPLADSPAYMFAVPRSFAPAFLRWLAASAAEFGFALSGTGRG
ncbi:sarcosine oxidase subunit gamma [Xanthobacter pseudotagetidis]|uniref:sarcosine oxidase subunit gamma n=1 Tax=Xanthobacter pseudotagetidis TaxID=3119911 RepID=UPI0037280FEA